MILTGVAALKLTHRVKTLQDEGAKTGLVEVILGHFDAGDGAEDLAFHLDVADVALFTQRRDFPRSRPRADAEHVVEFLAGDNPLQTLHLVDVGRRVVTDRIDGIRTSPELLADALLHIDRQAAAGEVDVAMAHRIAVIERIEHAADLPPMSAIWVNTGGPIPKGVTAIIPSAARSDLADAQKAAEPENGIMRRGAEWCVGDLLLKSGVRIGAAETALLFEAGMDVVKARSLASVGIIATGSELRDFVCRAEGPTRVSSDAAYLRSLLLDAGIRDVWARSAADDSEAIAAALTGLAVRSDVLITIGGTGRGSKDLTRRAILEAGGKLLDSQEADRCSGGASPFIAGELDGRPVIGLPGNPLAAMMIAQRVVLPLIAARSGIALHEKVVRAAFSGNIPAGKTGELCVSLCGCGDARIARAVQKGTGSVLLLRDAAGVVKVGKDGIKAGDEVDVICFIN